MECNGANQRREKKPTHARTHNNSPMGGFFFLIIKKNKLSVMLNLGIFLEC